MNERELKRIREHLKLTLACDCADACALTRSYASDVNIWGGSFQKIIILLFKKKRKQESLPYYFLVVDSTYKIQTYSVLIQIISELGVKLLKAELSICT